MRLLSDVCTALPTFRLRSSELEARSAVIQLNQKILRPDLRGGNLVECKPEMFRRRGEQYTKLFLTVNDFPDD
jgi:hypothetical protein